MSNENEKRSPYDELLKRGRSLLKTLNPSAKFDPGNCPEVAAAVHNYLNGKGIKAVRVRLLKGDFLLNGPDGRKKGLKQILKDLKKEGHGHNVVVEAKNKDRVHFMVLANIQTKIYYIDAYTKPPVITEKVEAYLKWANSLKVYKKFAVKFKPR